MTVTTPASVNGAPCELVAGTTLADLVSEWCRSPRGIAVARNGDIIPKSTWSSTQVAAGDRIEIVTAAAGG
jgi:sulfur carrier protein